MGHPLELKFVFIPDNASAESAEYIPNPIRLPARFIPTGPATRADYSVSEVRDKIPGKPLALLPGNPLLGTAEEQIPQNREYAPILRKDPRIFIRPNFPYDNGVLKPPPAFDKRDPRGGVLHEDDPT